MRKIKWIGVLALGLCITLNACTSVPEVKPKEPDTTDITASVFTRMVVGNGERYFGGESFILSDPEMEKVAQQVQLENWVPIFKPIYPYNIGVKLLDDFGNHFDFGIYNNKLLVVVTINPHVYYFEGPKEVFTQLKPFQDEFTQARLALPEYRDSVFVHALIFNTRYFEAWVDTDLNGKLDLTLLEGALKRDSWLMKENAAKIGSEASFQLTDSNGKMYRFFDVKALPDQVEIYDDPSGQNDPIAIYMIPNGVIESTQKLLKPMIVFNPVPESVKNAVFVKAYIDMEFYFTDADIKSDYGFTFTPEQKTQLNAFDRSTWIDPGFPIRTLDYYMFILYDEQGNAYCFDDNDFTNATVIKMIPKSRPNHPEYYLAPGLGTYDLFSQLVSAYSRKGAPKSVTGATFVSIEVSMGESSPYTLVSTLSKTQSDQMIEALDYPVWKQTVGEMGHGIFYTYRLTTSTGLKIYIAMDMASVLFPDGSRRHFDLPQSVLTSLTTFAKSLE